uniref:Putative secreted protein n=1 Tax=Anopheles marajoara TaxID=58244 RepID=A0A2M4CD30_9DIPT
MQRQLQLLLSLSLFHWLCLQPIWHRLRWVGVVGPVNRAPFQPLCWPAPSLSIFASTPGAPAHPLLHRGTHLLLR